MLKQHCLRVGFFSYISGALIYLIFPDTHPLLLILISTMGAMTGVTPNQFNSPLLNWNPILVIIKRNIIKTINIISDFNKQQILSNSANKIVNNTNRREPEFELISQKVPANIEWMRSKGFIVENYQESQAADPIYDRISLFLGKYYDVLKPLHRQIKIHQQDGKEIYFSLAQKSPDEISLLTNFCTLLNKNSFLNDYHYSSGRRLIRAITQSNPNMINFFTGDWFERYVFYKINELLTNSEIKFTFLKSSRGKHISGHYFELDFVFFIKNQPLWIECKSGQNYNSYLKKYSDYRKLLKIPKQRAFLIVADLTDAQAADYTKLWGITVVNIHNFVEEINKVVTNNLIEDENVSSMNR